VTEVSTVRRARTCFAGVDGDALGAVLGAAGTTGAEASGVLSETCSTCPRDRVIGDVMWAV
jgi:hypothetical protein